jgi:acyl-coenzyme A thioesterase PaaI-like protein
MYKTLWRETLLLWLFSFKNLPLVFWLKPRVIELTDKRGVLMMPFRRRSKNHVSSMYFGVLSAGADLAAGIVAMRLFHKQKEKFTFIFKDFQAEFLKRCEADTYFTCDQGDLVKEAIEKALQTKQRQNVGLNVVATVPAKYGDEAVCKFKITLSLKVKD